MAIKKIIKKPAKKPTKKIGTSKKIISKAIERVNSEPIKKDIKKSKTGKHWLWKPGQSGNPSGRKKGSYSVKSFKQILDKIGEEDVLTSPFVPPRLTRKFNCYSSITMKTAVMRVVYNMALAGKDWATRYIADYSEGKPKEFHEIVKKRVTIDIENETSGDIPEGEDIGNGDDEEDIITTSIDD